MEETRSKTLKEIAAEYLGQKPEELLNFALYPGGVTLIGKDGRKVRLHWEVLKGWKVDEVIAAQRKRLDGEPMLEGRRGKSEAKGREGEDGPALTEAPGKDSQGRGQKLRAAKRKAGGKP